MQRVTTAWILYGILVLLGGCSLAPDYNRPQLALPNAWTMDHESKGEGLHADWWTRFNDALLNSLIEEALSKNRTLAQSMAQVEAARAQLGLANANRFPTLEGEGQALPTWVDRTKVTDSTAPYSAGFLASWELDLWGKYKNASEAAKAELASSQASRSAMRLAVAGQTAMAYFTLLSLDIQIDIAQNTLATRQKEVQIYNDRYALGYISKLDLMQAKTAVETAQTTLHRALAAREAAEASLLVLVGRSPRSIMEETVSGKNILTNLQAVPVIPEGLPSELLERRPDIVAAEQTLIAANARIGVAKAAWFPSISLTGLLGIVSPHLHELFSGPQNTWYYGGTATVPLFEAGRIGAEVDSVKAAQQEALAGYEQAIQNAFADVRDALARQSEGTFVVASLEHAVADAQASNNLAKARYAVGYSSYLEVLDTERTLFQYQLELATAREEQLGAIVDVCMALGGGWDGGDGKDKRSIHTQQTLQQ